MGTKLFVGGLSWGTTDDSLKQAFSQAGTIVSASVIMDKMTGRSRGFGFVEMSSGEEAQKAIDLWNGKPLDGRTLVVNEAKPKEDRPRTGFGGGGFGGSRGGYGGGDRGHRGGGGGRGGHGSHGGFRGGNRGGFRDDTGGRDW